MINALKQILNGERRLLIKSGYLSYCENYVINHEYSTAKILGKSKSKAIAKVIYAYAKCIFRVVSGKKINPDKLKKQLADDIRNLYGVDPEKAIEFAKENAFFLS